LQIYFPILEVLIFAFLGAPISPKIELSYASRKSQPNFNGNLWERGRPISQLFDAGKDDPIVSWR
jgi:hypothetical protein